MKLNNLIFAHRGIFDNEKIPENSILAFTKAINNKKNIELDIQMTKDKKIVVFHDYNLKRMCNIEKNISDLTYDELNKINLLNTKEKIPTFEEVLKLVDGKVLLNIEIKNSKKYKEMCLLITDILDNYKHPFIIQSFYPNILKWFNKNKSNYTKGLLLNLKKNNRLTDKLLIFYCKPDFLSISKHIANNKFYFKHHVFIWTIKNIEEFNKYKQYTTNLICNNLPYEK